MRKNELIKLLQELKGNPEIVMWNGFVRDYHRLDKQLHTLTLVRETREFVKSSLEAEALRDGGPMPTEAEVDEAMKHREWEEPNPYLDPEDIPRWYGNKRKKLIVIQGKRRGKTYHDRIGGMEY